MSAGADTTSEGDVESKPPSLPEIVVCNSSPDKSVFIESGNTDGWISSDVTADVVR